MYDATNLQKLWRKNLTEVKSLSNNETWKDKGGRTDKSHTVTRDSHGGNGGHLKFPVTLYVTFKLIVYLWRVFLLSLIIYLHLKKQEWAKLSYGWGFGLNFINVLRTYSFHASGAQKLKKDSQVVSLFTLLGCTSVKAERKYVGEIEPCSSSNIQS